MTAVFASFTPTRVSRYFHEGRCVLGIEIALLERSTSAVVFVYIDERTCSVGCERVIFCFEASNTAFSITREALI